VLILDEPAAGLDPRARIELRDMISRLAAAGKAILISSHILTELAEISDRVAIIEQGRIVAVGSVAEISASVQSRATVRVRVLEDSNRLHGWLKRRDDIADVRLENELFTFTHAGDRRSEAALLKTLIDAGFAVVEFGVRHKSLEDVFLDVTKGRVQ
jgi:ABC-2 type transport system ATP-binding protein